MLHRLLESSSDRASWTDLQFLPDNLTVVHRGLSVIPIEVGFPFLTLSLSLEYTTTVLLLLLT